MTAHLWPMERFEAFYGALWKAVSKKDPKWARRFHAALMEQIMGSAGSGDEIMERLAGFDDAQKPGRPRVPLDLPSRKRTPRNTMGSDGAP